MECRSRGLRTSAVCLAAAASMQCSRPVDTATTPAAETLLECRAADIRHVLRIRTASHEVDDLAVSPVKSGTADISDLEYLLRFHEPRDNYDLVFQIDRSSGRGTRRLFDDEQQAIQGHGGTDDIACAPLATAR